MYKATKIRTFPNVAVIERSIFTAAKILPIPVGNLTDSLINRCQESFTPFSCSESMFGVFYAQVLRALELGQLFG